MEYIVETERLTGGYGKSMVLREVSLKVPKGCIYGFLGPNGAGKSTAMRMLLGLLRPASGEIRLIGEPLRSSVPGIFRRVGSLIEQPSLYDHLTGKENIEITRILRGLKPSDANRAIEAMGVSDYLEKRVKRYSRGMRQRLGLALAVLGNPELLLLDEPMNGMDASGLRTFRSMVQMLNRDHGTTIFLSSHQFEEVEQMATHIGIMSAAGDLLFQGTRDELSGRVPQELVIRVDRQEEGMKLLAGHGFRVQSIREQLVIQGATNSMAREVNRLLVTNEICVQHLELKSATLEALFLKITATVKAWDSK
jgi:lantibiotic transport system ATP-binding protein